MQLAAYCLISMRGPRTVSSAELFSCLACPVSVQLMTRKSVCRRKQARERQTEHKAERAAQQAEEVKRLKRLKRAELDAQCALLQLHSTPAGALQISALCLRACKQLQVILLCGEAGRVERALAYHAVQLAR